jgi:hypothetical protein
MSKNNIDSEIEIMSITANGKKHLEGLLLEIAEAESVLFELLRQETTYIDKQVHDNR